MRNACPTCQTVYAVTPADVGRRIVCTRCNAALVIDEDGFRITDGSGGSKAVPPPRPPERKKGPPPPKAPPPKDDDTADADPPDDEDTIDSTEVRRIRRSSRRERDESEPEPSPVRRYGLLTFVDVPTAVFAVGVVAVLWFLFMPLIGTAKHRWYTARIEDEQLAHDKEVKRLRDTGKAESVPKLEEEWRKRKEKLEQDVQWVQINNRQSEYWDRYGMLAGFILTAIGSIGLLMTHQPTVKKIVGAVVVCAMMILVFVSFAWKG